MPRPSILVVDDEPGMRETLRDVLDLVGFEVETASDGVEALEQLEKAIPKGGGHEAEPKNGIAAVIMDIVMPRMNGVEALKQILGQWPDTLVILMTGYSISTLISEAQKSGCAHILKKPLNLQKLLELLPQPSLTGNGHGLPTPGRQA